MLQNNRIFTQQIALNSTVNANLYQITNSLNIIYQNLWFQVMLIVYLMVKEKQALQYQ